MKFHELAKKKINKQIIECKIFLGPYLLLQIFYEYQAGSIQLNSLKSSNRLQLQSYLCNNQAVKNFPQDSLKSKSLPIEFNQFVYLLSKKISDNERNYKIQPLTIPNVGVSPRKGLLFIKGNLPLKYFSFI